MLLRVAGSACCQQVLTIYSLAPDDRVHGNFQFNSKVAASTHEMRRLIAISLSKPSIEYVIGLRWTVLDFVGCVRPVDAR